MENLSETLTGRIAATEEEISNLQEQLATLTEEKTAVFDAPTVEVTKPRRRARKLRSMVVNHPQQAQGDQL